MKIKQIESIELVMENCEYYVIPQKLIQCFTIKGIKKDIFANIMGQCSEYKSADYVYIMIENFNDIKPGYNWMEDSFIERVKKFNDIAQIILNYEDGEKFNVCVPWGEDENTNEYQTMTINDNWIEIEFKKDSLKN